VVANRLRGELRYRWEDTGSIASEKDQVLRVMVTDARNLDIGDVLDGVCATCVLGQCDIIVVDLTGLRVEHNVLQDGSKADSVVNIGLLLSRQADALGVTSSLNVEDTSIGPAVLIITDQSTVGIGGEGRLASARETEEQSNIAILALVGRRVESKYVVLDRHLVEENGEDALLHLACVLGTKDNHLLLGKVDSHGGGRSHTGGKPVCRDYTMKISKMLKCN